LYSLLHQLILKENAGFIWAGTALITLIWAVFRLPETKDRTYEELDVLFLDKVPAHKFTTVVVNNTEVSAGVKDAIAAQIDRA
jgi:hypothetical protein